MKNTVALKIKGKPIAKKRPRFARHGKFVRTYSDQETEEGRFLWEVRNQLDGHQIFNGALFLTARFFMPIPKSTSKKKRAMMLNDEIHHTKKPDVDNCIKFICDCLNGVVYRDDSQIFSKHGIKRYSDEPRTEIEITQISEI